MFLSAAWGGVSPVLASCARTAVLFWAARCLVPARGVSRIGRYGLPPCCHTSTLLSLAHKLRKVHNYNNCSFAGLGLVLGLGCVSSRSAPPSSGPFRAVSFNRRTYKTNTYYVTRFDKSTLPLPLRRPPTHVLLPLQVATRLGKKSDAAPKYADAPSPLKRRLSNLGKAVASAISRDTGALSETEAVPGRTVPSGGGSRGNGDAFQGPRAAGKAGTPLSIGRFTVGVAGINPRSPVRRPRTMSDEDDFGVQLDDVSW